MTETVTARRLWVWPLLSLLAVLLLGLGAAWLAGWPSPDPAVARPLAQETPARAAPSPSASAREPQALAAAPAADLGPAVGAASAPVPEPAHWHLADTRVMGDERAPPLVRAPQAPIVPRWQLDDPTAYLAREAQEHRAVQQAFVEAADRELPALRRLLDQAREQGLSPDGIAKGEEKLRRIAEQRDAMRAALAADPPP
ncbi:hypothetical protein QRD43_00240 [Pelomonas sp. APW6]|uniref:Uncharacterized protein n=1 Tax=Roseateles subflavus TaxID=3053353 RepID=A0ABT7LFA0_9BURK|nr:hypothetical protein [Pelomonas sp. APW6]MDL5030315.1 hypothetical protein [Pelomonas sp. APW6]